MISMIIMLNVNHSVINNYNNKDRNDTNNDNDNSKSQRQ